jgi:hypothetical protein
MTGHAVAMAIVMAAVVTSAVVTAAGLNNTTGCGLVVSFLM